MKLTKDDPILKIGRLPQVLVTTMTIPYSKTANYKNIVGKITFFPMDFVILILVKKLMYVLTDVIFLLDLFLTMLVIL